MKEFVIEVLLNLLVEFILDCLKEKDMFADMPLGVVIILCFLLTYMLCIIVLYNKIAKS